LAVTDNCHFLNREIKRKKRVINAKAKNVVRGTVLGPQTHEYIHILACTRLKATGIHSYTDIHRHTQTRTTHTKYVRT